MESHSAQQKADARRALILEGNLLRVIPVIALPQVVTMLIDAFYNIADTYFVSQLGDAATAAVGVNDSLMHLIRSLSFVFAVGMSSYLSRLLGAKEDEEASRAASTTLVTAMGAVFAIATLANLFAAPLVTLLGATESAKAYSVDYARWTLLFAPVTAGTVCLTQTLRGEGSTTFSMIGSVSGCIANLILDPILIFGFGLEVAGAALATGISKVISFSLLLVPFLRRKTVVVLSAKHVQPSRALFAEIARMGIPTGLRSGMLSVGTIVVNHVAGGFGDAALAAVSVANKCMKLINAAIMGFGQGYQPIAGFCWGAKKYARGKQAFYYTLLIGLAISVVFGSLLARFAEQTLLLFTNNTGTLDVGVVLIRSQCLVLPLHMAVSVVTGMFQATGKAARSALLGLCRQLFSLIPCVIILSKLFGLGGLAWAQAVADVISFFIALVITLPMLREMTRLALQEKEIIDI